MTFSPSSAALGGLVLGGGRKLGGMIDKRMDGANMVHAVAIQGMFNAHAQQQDHQNHLKSIRAAYKMAPNGGFHVQTGNHSLHIEGGAGAGPAPTRSKSTAVEPSPSGGGHDANGNRTPGQDHYENGVKHANGMMDTLQARMEAMRGAGHNNAAEDLTAAARGAKALEKPTLAITARPVSTTTNPRGGRVVGSNGPERTASGAIPMGNKSSTTSKGGSRGVGAVDRTKAGKVNNRLNRLEANHLATRQAKLKGKG